MSFHPAVREWFASSLGEPTPVQALAWPVLHRRESALLLAPTGSGKTLAAFLSCIDRLMFAPAPEGERCRVLYVSPLKALAVDVERNLRAPLAGIARVAAGRGDAHRVPTAVIRTGDTPSKERARFARDPSDILITTPESLYLLLTSNAREALSGVETVIVDEIHALVPTKRGAHLALSLERLERWVKRPLQRIGLSATQRPLDEIARFLGGATVVREPPVTASEVEGRANPSPREEFVAPGKPIYRPVTLVNAGARKALELKIEVPVEDMALLGKPIDLPSGPAAQGPVRASIWTAIHPRLLELVKAHRSTLIFVNSRRVAERLAAALNELAGELLVHAHHGSIARAQRSEIEDKLKLGQVRGLVATSSLELGIDMGAIDLVVQIEAPPSVASGMQRIGRAGHQVNAPSRGVVFPKFRSDLVACAALTRAMIEGEVESTRYPRNPLDVLAQQIVAMVALESWPVEQLYDAVRGAAPFCELSRGIFDGVLDMLAGRYDADELSDLRPRVTWDRVAGTVTAREGARRIAVINGGTIPDRGLYGVFLLGADRQRARVGELDEEMVFESRVGETFLLGASSWRIEEITHDRVLVSPAPGEPGKMPFWHGDSAGRPLELGRKIGALVRELSALPRAAAQERLTRLHQLDETAAQNLLQYLADQRAATTALPDDRTIVIERCRDELGDWRICVLSPLGGQVHAPWAMAVAAKVKEETGIDAETMWTNDGFVVRFPDTEAPPDSNLLLPGPEEVEALVVRQLGGTALFAAKFREAAARALLLPKRSPARRAPLWQQRKRAADLLAAASRHGSFPMILEAYRECLRDVFDMPALVAILRDVARRELRVVTVDSQVPSPFASSLLFGFVANYIYDGDAPMAERRAQALAIDQAQLRELLGEAELRELLDPDAFSELEEQLQLRSSKVRARSADGIHDLLLRLGDLSAQELEARSEEAAFAQLGALLKARRVLEVPIGGRPRLIAVEHAARYRDALGVPLPPGLPEALLASPKDALGDLVLRYARTHLPFTADELGERYGLPRRTLEPVLQRLAAAEKLEEGAFRPGGAQREWTDPEVLRTLRRRSLAKLRREVEPVPPRALARLFTAWQGVTRRRPGLDALLDAIERLQGLALPASLLEQELLAARVEGYSPMDLDALLAAGEVVWCGVEPMGERDGRVALYLTDALPRLWRPPVHDPLNATEQRLLDTLRDKGACFFGPLLQALGGGFPRDALDALWGLVWKGLVTNDAFRAVRAYVLPVAARPRRLSADGRAFRSRRVIPATAEGRWSLIEERAQPGVSDTEWSVALAEQLLSRYGVVTREVGAAEALRGGFGAVYDVLKRFEEAGKVRRGYFVAGTGAMQFASPPALELLRTLKDAPEVPEVLRLSAVDPANPYGVMLSWPATADGGAQKAPARAAGATVILYDGAAAAYLSRGGRSLSIWLPEDEPDRGAVAKAVAEQLKALALKVGPGKDGMLISEINGGPAVEHPAGAALISAGFTPSAHGFHLARAGREGSVPALDLRGRRRRW